MSAWGGQLDAAKDGEEFGGVLWRMFAAADAARDKAEDELKTAAESIHTHDGRG